MSSSSQVITCKGAICWGIGEGLKVEEIQVDPPKASEVRPMFPQALGNEGVGVVESIGEKVTDHKVGDIVIPIYIAECGECGNCVSEESNICMRYPLMVNGLMPDGTHQGFLLEDKGHTICLAAQHGVNIRQSSKWIICGCFWPWSCWIRGNKWGQDGRSNRDNWD
ncbi:hypothetical protein K1719_036544 [Acacia pycnantha]|nr:hypothetical protein K1719_036544 [Acacia pycnantha]